MARAPQAKVHKTTGQGVSRLSYQKGYSLGNRGKSGGSTNELKLSSDPAPSKRDYGKSKKVDYPGGINVSYGNTYEPGDLADLKALADRKS